MDKQENAGIMEMYPPSHWLSQHLSRTCYTPGTAPGIGNRGMNGADTPGALEISQHPSI